MKILLATGNPNKVKEIQAMLSKDIEVIASPIEVDVDEYGASCSANSIIKAFEYYKTLASKKLLNDINYIIADDSGIFVPELGDNVPGVLSARFSLCDYKDKKLIKTNKKASNSIDLSNNKLLLELLKNNVNREAYYLSSLALISNRGDFINLFEGITFGKIDTKLVDESGWGYDHVFISQSGNHWGKVNPKIKNLESHRGKATFQLKSFLKKFE